MSFSIYHCGHCGSLFPAELGQDDDRVCGVCKQRPGTGEWPVESENDDRGRESPASLEKSPESPEERVHRAAVKRRSSNLMSWIVGLWVLLMGSALWLHRHNSRLGLVEGSIANSEANLEQERAAFLEAALPQCHRSLLGFLNAKSTEERLQFVADPLATSRKMGNFHASNPYPQVNVGQVGRVGQELLELEGERVVRTRWQEGAEGGSFDAVFRRESGAWVLDWDHFAHFSDYPWRTFLTGDGPGEGEFRLLAREIPSADETERRGRLLRFELLSPEAVEPSGNPVVSQQFMVGRHSDEGLLLGAAFAAKREGGGPFGGGMKPMEPEGLVRVRVVVKRSDFGGVRKFEIARLIACHWITSDEPGFDLGKLKDDVFGPN